MSRKRKRKPPPVLHKSLNGQSRSLGDAILSLLPRPPPPSPEQCRSCRGGLCLACLGRSHLVDDEADPTEYRNLLARSFCYVPPSAPSPPLLFTPCGHTQRKVVRNTIEKLMSDPKSRANLLCVGYDEQSRFSLNGEALSTHAWDILLERIGDRLMIFLLEHSSIFLYLTNRSYQQVTGPPLSEMLEGCTRKRQRINYEEKFPSVAGCTSVCDNHDNAIQSSATTVGSKNYLACGFQSKSRKHKRLFSRHRMRKHKKLLQEPEGPSASDRSRKALDLGDGNSVGIHELSLSQDAEAINNEKSCSNNAGEKTNGPLASTSAENNGHAPFLLLGNPPDRKSRMGNLGSQSHLEMNFCCFHGFKLGTAGKAATDDKINRRRMFYNTSWSSSVFQKEHILNKVKPDGPGAALLLEHIFGLSTKDFRACSCHDGASASSSDCSYHCLLGLLKSLIRNSQNCLHKKMLRKCCPSTILKKYKKDGRGLASEGRSGCVDKNTLHSLMAEHLQGNILRIGWRFYLQKVGICQGGSISSLLCSFYLAHLERSKILPHLEKARGLWHWRDHTSGYTDDVRHENSSSPSNMLLRLIDDFLFISTSKEQATTFFNRVYKGFGEYNCSMNNSKFGLNFDLGKAKHLPNRLYTGADGIQFLPWSGLLINCRTLEIQADYTRYLNIHIRFTITVQAKDNPGSSLKAKLCDYMHPKCNAIFYDSNINSSTIVRLNAYQAFLLCAMKFHCYVCSIPHNTELNPSYLLEIIERSFRYMYKLVKNQIYSMKVHNTHPVLRLKREEMIWLGLSAYIWILKKKQARHKKLLKLLRCKLFDCGKMVDDLSSLKYATEDSHSSVFQDIKF